MNRIRQKVNSSDYEAYGIHDDLDDVDRKLSMLLKVRTAELIITKSRDGEPFFGIAVKKAKKGTDAGKSEGTDAGKSEGTDAGGTNAGRSVDNVGLGIINEAYDATSEELNNSRSDGTPINTSAMSSSGGPSRNLSSAGTATVGFGESTGDIERDRDLLIYDMISTIQEVKTKVALAGCSIKGASEKVAETISSTSEEVMNRAKGQLDLGIGEKISLLMAADEQGSPLSVMIPVISIILAIFLAIGAGGFVWLEGSHEETEKTDIEAERTYLLKLLLNETFTIQNATGWLATADSQIKDYETKLYQSFQHGVSSDTDVRVWTYWKALFFVSTITTTIGYGHISPVTTGGRILAIVYAVVGIPLMTILLADLGTILARIVKTIFKFIRELDGSKMCTMAYVRSLKPRCIAFLKCICWRRPSTERAPDDVAELVTRKEETQDDIDNYYLPYWVALILLFIYVVIGGFLFILWEDWSFGEAFYFTFISISTIGFGDLVPENLSFMMITTLYLVFGLSFTAMTVDIIMEAIKTTLNELTLKFKKIFHQIIEDDKQSKEEGNGENQRQTKDRKWNNFLPRVIRPAPKRKFS